MKNQELEPKIKQLVVDASNIHNNVDEKDIKREEDIITKKLFDMVKDLKTEDEFKEYFKKEGFELYKTQPLEEKLHEYHAMKEARDAHSVVLDQIYEIVKPDLGDSIVHVIRKMKENSK